MSQESTPSSPPGQARRRIIALPERQNPLPVALIAHEGEERELLEAQIARARPVECFPSLAHFDGNGRARWAGIIVARSHGWDARLDTYVLRRAFIALFGVTDEGYGWPEAIQRINTHEELDDFLAVLAAPNLPADDRPRATKPRAKRSIITMSLARDDAGPAQIQLALPSVMGVTDRATRTPLIAATAATVGRSAFQIDLRAADVTPTEGSGEVAATGGSEAEVLRSTLDSSRMGRKSENGRVRAPRHPSTDSEGGASLGLRLTSPDPAEQVVLDAVRSLGVDAVRTLVQAIEECELL